MLGIDFCQVKSEITTKFILFLRHIKNSLIYLNKILNEFIIKDKKKQNFE
jgi:hypothetical protein